MTELEYVRLLIDTAHTAVIAENKVVAKSMLEKAKYVLLHDVEITT